MMTLTSAYLPPISWFATLRDGEPFFVEACENYHKQTIRNRCEIDSPNGRLALTIPVDKGNFVGGKCQMRDVKISTHAPWQRQHWYALESSYYNSPFFEYLQDDFRPLYERQWTYLMDFNEALIRTCFDLLDLHPLMQRTTTWQSKDSTPLPLRGGDGGGASYYQVFAHKHGFLPDLSIIDLIFNLGPEAQLYIASL